MEIKHFDYDFLGRFKDTFSSINLYEISDYTRLDQRIYFKFITDRDKDGILLTIETVAIPRPPEIDFEDVYHNFESLYHIPFQIPYACIQKNDGPIFIDNAIKAELLYQHISKVCDRFFMSYGRANLGKFFAPPSMKLIYTILNNSKNI